MNGFLPRTSLSFQYKQNQLKIAIFLSYTVIGKGFYAYLFPLLTLFICIKLRYIFNFYAFMPSSIYVNVLA